MLIKQSHTVIGRIMVKSILLVDLSPLLSPILWVYLNLINLLMPGPYKVPCLLICLAQQSENEPGRGLRSSALRLPPDD